MSIRLKFSVHAQVRMVEREFQAEHIKATILSPDFARKQQNGTVKARKKLKDGRELTVIYYKEDFRGANDHLIITAYYN